jgi:hypothetical protein
MFFWVNSIERRMLFNPYDGVLAIDDMGWPTILWGQTIVYAHAGKFICCQLIAQPYAMTILVTTNPRAAMDPYYGWSVHRQTTMPVYIES